MEPPQPQVNTFVKINKEDDLIDPISKVFILSQNICGIYNRGVYLDFVKPKLSALAFIYAVILNTVVLYFISQKPKEDIVFNIMVSTRILQHLNNCFLTFIFGKRMRQFFELIAKFDKETQIALKVSREQTEILLQAIAISTFTTAVFIDSGSVEYVLFHLNYYLETHFYGYLISLLFQRLRLINNFIETPVFAKIFLANIVVKRQKKYKNMQFPMNTLMDYYQIIVSAFEVLTDAIKWQFVSIVTTSFFFFLTQSIKIADLLKSREDIFWPLLPWYTVNVMEMLSFLVPCVCCDLLRAQVRRLRELVAFKIYENKLDKSGRSNARALLALTETSSLSFSLFRVVDVSISLLFSLVGLLVTYLIIFLQFQKVIDLKAAMKV